MNVSCLSGVELKDGLIWMGNKEEVAWRTQATGLIS